MTNNDKKLWDYHQTINRDSFKNSVPRLDFLYKLIEQYNKESPINSIADMGFGDGYLLSLLSKKTPSVLGIDISEKNIALTKERLPSVSFKLAHDGLIPLKKESLDALCASEVLEHMTDQELEKSISEGFRVLKPGGYWFVTVPAREDFSLNTCFCPECGHEFHKWGHKQYWDEKKIEDTFSQLFEIQEVQERRFESGTSDLYQKIFVLLRSVAFKLRGKISRGTYCIVLKKPL